MVGITCVFIDTIFGFYGYFFFYPSLLLSWMFEHDCVDTCCFWVSYMHGLSVVFVYLHLISPSGHVSALEIRSLLLSYHDLPIIVLTSLDTRPTITTPE